MYNNVKSVQYLLTFLSFHHSWHLAPQVIAMHGVWREYEWLCHRPHALYLVRWNGWSQWMKACFYTSLELLRMWMPTCCGPAFSSFTFTFFLMKKVRSRLASIPRRDPRYSKRYLIKGVSQRLIAEHSVHKKIKNKSLQYLHEDLHLCMCICMYMHVCFCIILLHNVFRFFILFL